MFGFTFKNNTFRFQKAKVFAFDFKNKTKFRNNNLKT